MSFRLSTVLWAFALAATAMATFGAVGAVIVLLILVFWIDAFDRKGRSRGRLLLIAVVVVGFLFPYFTLHGIDWVTLAYARRAQCRHNLQDLALALTSYADQNGAFPPAEQPGEGRAGPRSWRVDVLSMLDDPATAARYRRDRSWDSPHNVGLSILATDAFTCPGGIGAGTTSYFAVVGPHAAWPLDRGRPIHEISDGTRNTILLVEMAGRGTPWSKPEDLTFDEAVALLTDPPLAATVHRHERRHGFFYKVDERPGLHVAFADGSVRFLALPLSTSLATALLTADGGEIVNESEFDRASLPQLDFGRIYALTTFVALSLLPVWYLVRRRWTS